MASNASPIVDIERPARRDGFGRLAPRVSIGMSVARLGKLAVLLNITMGDALELIIWLEHNIAQPEFVTSRLAAIPDLNDRLRLLNRPAMRVTP